MMTVSMCEQVTWFVSVSRDGMLLAYHRHYVPLLAVAVVNIIARNAHWLLTGTMSAMAEVPWVGYNTGLNRLCGCITCAGLLCSRF